MSRGAELTVSANAAGGTSASVISAVSRLTNFIFPPYYVGFRFSAFKLLIYWEMTKYQIQ
jgi:anionic cell wall polymer biosynthesis LytR-Cps2A-Psr (LCP) family protein